MTDIHEFYAPPERTGPFFLYNLRHNLLNYFVNLMQETGAYACYKILNNRVILLNDTTAIRYLFVDNYKNYHKSRYNDVLKPVLGGGIFLSEDEDWRQQRHEAASMFANGRFPEMTEQMAAAAHSMFNRWDKKITAGEHIDINLETMWYALDVALRAFFHQEKEEIAQGVQEHLGNLLREAEGRIWSILKLPQKWTMKLPKYRKSLSFLHDITTELIEERKRSSVYPDDLLSRAIQSCDGSSKSLKILQDKVMSYLTSAHETTANAMAWTWFELGQRPEILKRMISEIDQLVGHRSPTYDDIKQMDYTRHVFEETLRLYPPVWTMSREALNDDHVPLDDGSKLAIKRGDTIMLSPYVIHRREEYWPYPIAFDPERFMKNNETNRSMLSYFPFGGGARLCLGFRFAQIEAVVLMVMMVQRYDMTLIPGQNIVPEPMITLRPSQPVWFKMRHREKTQDVEIPIPAEKVNVEVCPYHLQKGAQKKQAA